MRSVILAWVVLLSGQFVAFAETSSGTVVYAATGCDYFIVQASGGDFALLEWYGGAVPSTGDRIVGNFETYGFIDIVNLSSRESTHVWVEDYWLSQSSVVNKYTQKCGRAPIRQNSPSRPNSQIGSPSGIIQSTIQGEFNGWDGETIFILDNGQVWQQASYSYHYHYAYRPRVTIAPTSAGFVMQVEGVNQTILVRQIR